MSDEPRSPAPVPSPRGPYLLFCIDGRSVFSSALGPFDATEPSGFSHIGRLGADLGVDEGRAAAAMAAKALLRALEDQVGSLDAIEQVLTVRGYLATTDDFVHHALVMNGASETIIEVLGERGNHTRTTVGVASLPFGLPVVVELSARLVAGITT